MTNPPNLRGLDVPDHWAIVLAAAVILALAALSTAGILAGILQYLGCGL